MKTAALLLASLFGAWFWRTTSPAARTARWPSAMPVFAGGHPHSSYTLNNGTSFVCLTVPETPQGALESARDAYRADGWRESPVRTHDMLVFQRGDAVAIVLAQDTPAGTRVTALQRPKGL